MENDSRRQKTSHFQSAFFVKFFGAKKWNGVKTGEGPQEREEPGRRERPGKRERGERRAVTVEVVEVAVEMVVVVSKDGGKQGIDAWQDAGRRSRYRPGPGRSDRPAWAGRAVGGRRQW